MKKEPLANRMRPTNLDEIVGQESIIGKGTVLRKRIEKDNLLSIILWGSPGTGKTTIAEVIAKTTKYKFYKLNAVTAGVSDIKAIIQETENPLYCPEGSSILFVDEIHRFNKATRCAASIYRKWNNNINWSNNRKSILFFKSCIIIKNNGIKIK